MNASRARALGGALRGLALLSGVAGLGYQGLITHPGAMFYANRAILTCCAQAT